LGEGKIEHEEKIWELYANNREKLKQYNLRDVQLLYMLEQKMNVVKMSLLECKICKSFLSRFWVGELLDNYMLRNAVGVKWPSPFDHGEFTPYAGAWVMEPITGLHENVYCFDFKSLYPTIIKTLNVSIDSHLSDEEGEKLGKDAIKTINGVYFRKEQGAIPRIIEGLLQERQKIKKELKTLKFGTPEYNAVIASQAAIKELGNSMYGILGYRKGRYFNLQFAEAITLTGQHIIKEAMRYLEEKREATVLYSDTDSLFVTFQRGMTHEEMIEIGREIDSFVARFMKEEFNAENSHITIEYEKRYKTLLLVDKKKYMGLIDYQDEQIQDKIHGRGIESVKKDTIKYARALQKELMERLLRDKSTKREIEKWCDEQKQRYMDSKLEKEDLTISIRISKPIEEYKNSDIIHIKIAKQLKANKKEFYIGMNVPFVVTSSSPKLDGVYAEEFNGEYDKSYYWNNRIFPMCARVLYVVYPKSNWNKFYISDEDEMKLHGQKALSDYV
jgi:DNA polymerase elongation subunit (family B)